MQEVPEDIPVREVNATGDDAITISGLSMVYGNDVRALDDVSFSIPRGTVVGYIGPNGSGKTTTIKIITNLLKPTTGKVIIDGIDVTKDPKAAMKHVGALIEVPGVYDYLTPREMLTYFGKVHRMDSRKIESRITEVLKLVKLQDWEHHRIGGFSTGMSRRMALAKAIFHEPDILILDEPVIGLDPKGIRDVRDLIRMFRDQGITIFLSSHLLQELSEVCDSVIFLDVGKVVKMGRMEDIEGLDEQRMIDVTFLTPQSVEDTERIRSIEAIVRAEFEDDHARFENDGSPEGAASILKQMIDMGIEVVSYTPERMDLEDIYVNLMGDERGVSS